MRSKRWLLLGIAGTGALALLAVTQIWVHVSLQPGAAAFEMLELRGYEINPAISPVAIASLATALVLTIAGRVFRQLLGALVMLLGVGIVMMALTAMGDPMSASSGSVADVTGISGAGQQVIIAGVGATMWPSLAVAAGVLLLAQGALVVGISHKWKVAGRRYASSEDRSPTTPTRDTASGEPDRISDWDAMNHGEDPTSSREAQ